MKITRTEDSLVAISLPCLTDIVADAALLWRLVTYERFGVSKQLLDPTRAAFQRQKEEFIPCFSYLSWLYHIVPVVTASYILIVLMWSISALNRRPRQEIEQNGDVVADPRDCPQHRLQMHPQQCLRPLWSPGPPPYEAYSGERFPMVVP